MSSLPLVHIAKNGNGSKEVVCLDIGETLPVVDNSFVGFSHVQGGSLKRVVALAYGYAEVQSKEIKPVGLVVHIPLPLCCIFSAKVLGLQSIGV